MIEEKRFRLLETMFNDLFVEEDDPLPAVANAEVQKGKKVVAKPTEERASCGFMGLKVRI